MYFQNTVSDQRIVNKRVEDPYQCELCQRKFAEVHYLSRHKREETRTPCPLSTLQCLISKIQDIPTAAPRGGMPTIELPSPRQDLP